MSGKNRKIHKCLYKRDLHHFHWHFTRQFIVQLMTCQENRRGGEAFYNSPNSLSRSSQFELPGRMFGNLSNNDSYSFKNMNKSETTDSSDGCFGSLKQTCITQNRKQPVPTSSLSAVLLTPEDDLSLADPLSVLREPQDSRCGRHLGGASGWNLPLTTASRSGSGQTTDEPVSKQCLSSCGEQLFLCCTSLSQPCCRHRPPASL